MSYYEKDNQMIIKHHSDMVWKLLFSEWLVCDFYYFFNEGVWCKTAEIYVSLKCDSIIQLTWICLLFFFSCKKSRWFNFFFLFYENVWLSKNKKIKILE